jgi:hypothetical protein
MNAITAIRPPCPYLTLLVRALTLFGRIADTRAALPNR